MTDVCFLHGHGNNQLALGGLSASICMASAGPLKRLRAPKAVKYLQMQAQAGFVKVRGEIYAPVSF